MPLHSDSLQGLPPAPKGSVSPSLVLLSRFFRAAVSVHEAGGFTAEQLKSHFALWPLLDFHGAHFSLTELNRKLRAIGRDRDAGVFRKRHIRVIVRELQVQTNSIILIAVARHPAKAQLFLENRYGDGVDVLVAPEDTLASGETSRQLRRLRREHRAERLRARAMRVLAPGNR